MNTFTTLKGLLTVAAKQDNRFYLNAVHVTATRMQASDGHLGMQVDTDTKMPAGVAEVLLCRQDLAVKLKMFTAKSDIELRVLPEGGALLQQMDGGRELGQAVPVATVDGRYPDLTRATSTMRPPNTPVCTLGLNVKLAAQACNAMAAVGVDAKFPAAEFNLYDAGVRLTRGPVNVYVLACRL